MKKITNVLLTVFSIGVLCALFAGAMAIVGFIAALIIGGETATALCVFIHKTYFPWIIKATSVFTLFGLVGMYLSKQKALTAESENVKNLDK